MNDYLEKLKDPRWQKKRLEILERDGWKCKICYSSQKTLNVHHLIYIRDQNPWEINNGFLLTVCEECHQTLKQDTLNPDFLVNDIGDLLQALWSNGHDSFSIMNLTNAIEVYGKPPYSTPDKWDFILKCQEYDT